MALALVRGSLRAGFCARAGQVFQATSGAFDIVDSQTLTADCRISQQSDEGRTLRLSEAGFAFRSSFHTSNPQSDATTSGGGSASAAELEEKRRSINKILYRSRQRGLLELDLLIGKWASENVPRMDGQAMDHYTQILDEENPDLWKWLTEQAEAPADLKTNPVFESLCKYVRKDLEAKADPATRTEPGKAWVRGWNDSDRKVGGPPAGNQ
ncbi:hypothetical protein KFL_009160010 [Klebsormidium nitens]|uniref:Succinate dehydrogenase assembly factor 2, mitochondrial n=1 Tax=Klebsormidium nitens TaxID=105231 RepID=A0A1Y1IME3_KLENI|nr:hypothetical protein KFL_009160010 [Klebsormidium nitens]|eukprot:GAQ92065.1 hypothetical protein KFL_009160010 [Klebsormidium nitens]